MTDDPHRATLDRFLRTPHDLAGTWLDKFPTDAGPVVAQGDDLHVDDHDLDSHPLPPEYDPHADAHGDACPGDCEWRPCPLLPTTCPGPDDAEPGIPRRTPEGLPLPWCACGESGWRDRLHTVTCCHERVDLAAGVSA